MDFPEGFLWGTATSGFQTEAGRARATPTAAGLVGMGPRSGQHRRRAGVRRPAGDGPGSWTLHRRDAELAPRPAVRTRTGWASSGAGSSPIGRGPDEAAVERLSRACSRS